MDLRGHGLSDAPTDDGATTSPSWPTTSSPSPRARGCSTTRPRGRPRRPRVRGIVGRRGRRPRSAIGAPASSSSTAASSTCRRRPARRRRVPARPRRAAGGHALDARLPRRSARLRSRRPGTPTRSGPPGRPSSRRRPAGSSRRPRPHALEAAVRTMFAYRPDRVLPRVDGADRRASAGSTPGDEIRARRRRARCRAAAAGGLTRRSTPGRRPQPAPLPPRRGHGRDPRPLGLRRAGVARHRGGARVRVVYSPAHLAHDIVTETVMGAVIPANEVAERAERIRTALEADGGFAIAEPTEHGTRADPGRPRRGPRAVPRGGVARGRAPGDRPADPGRRHVPDVPDVRGHERRSSSRPGRSRSSSAGGPAGGASTRRTRSSPGRTARRGRPSTSR